MTSPPCGVCAEVARSVAVELGPDRKVTVCAHCGVSAFLPMPTAQEIHGHYSSYYLTKPKTEERHRTLVEAHERILAYLVAHLADTQTNSAKILDFGFGSGEFLVCAARRGHRAYGSDLNADSVAGLRALASAAGVDLTPVPLADVAEGPDRFDVITMFQVVEHLPNPLDVVRQLSAAQPVGGLLYVECPNNEGAVAMLKSALIQGQRRRRMWRTLKYPEHLHGFTESALESLMRVAGYETVDVGVYTFGDGLHQVETEYWWPTWRSNAERWSPYGASRTVVRWLDSLGGRIGRGGGLYALGRKA